MEEKVVFAFVHFFCCLVFCGGALLYVKRQVQWERYVAFFHSLSRLGETEETKALPFWSVWTELNRNEPPPLLLGVFMSVGLFTSILLVRILGPVAILSWPITFALAFATPLAIRTSTRLLKALDERCVRGLTLIMAALEKGEKLSLPVEVETPPTSQPSVEDRVNAQWALLEKYLTEHSSRQHITLSLNDVDENNPLFEVNVRKLEQEKGFFPHKGHCRSGCDSKGEICLILNKKPQECVLF
jgi:hypothetical protein